MSEGKIVGLRGEYVPLNGVPHQGCVDLLESLLAEAKAGKLHAIAASWDNHDYGVRWSLVGSGMGFDMIGGLEMAKAEIIRRMPEPL